MQKLFKDGPDPVRHPIKSGELGRHPSARHEVPQSLVCTCSYPVCFAYAIALSKPNLARSGNMVKFADQNLDTAPRRIHWQ